MVLRSRYAVRAAETPRSAAASADTETLRFESRGRSDTGSYKTPAARPFALRGQNGLTTPQFAPMWSPRRCLIQQTLQPAEVVVVDGGSTDGTWERLQASALAHANLKAIRDESCSLKGSPGPIARGRNVAITAASSEVIACADAGCVYRPDWLENLTEPILSGRAEYALGGSCLDAGGQTTWDIASAPFFGIKLDPNQETKSCTARSMAFRKKIWQKVGGFPEDRLIGEDSLFDLRVRQIVIPAHPQY